VSDTHTVEQGEYLASIAKDYGFSDWHTIYDHPQNADLKKRRPNPDILFPGDEVFIPDKAPKHESCATKKKHRFQVKVPKALLKLVLKDSDGKALANQPYTLTMAWLTYNGSTDGAGSLQQKIPIGIETAQLNLDKLNLGWTLKIAHLDPIPKDQDDEAVITATQARLENLGFDCGGVTGTLDDKTQAALQGFQKSCGLPVDGTCNSETLAKLQELHGC